MEYRQNQEHNRFRRVTTLFADFSVCRIQHSGPGELGGRIKGVLDHHRVVGVQIGINHHKHLGVADGRHKINKQKHPIRANGIKKIGGTREALVHQRQRLQQQMFQNHQEIQEDRDQ